MYLAPPAALQAFWAALAELLRADGGIAPGDVPASLRVAADCHVQWLEPDLLISQACGYPLVTQLAGQVQLVGTLAYDAPGVQGIQCRSQLVCRASDARQRLEDFAGSRLAFNDAISQSGYNALRALLAAHGTARSFFSEALHTGGHLHSIAAVREGRADMASIDAVTWALWLDAEPELASTLRVFGQTEAYPGLPLITSRHTPGESLSALRRCLRRLCADPATATLRAPLRISGFVATSVADYRVCLDMQARAYARGLRSL